jgi:hypothetical protein
LQILSKKTCLMSMINMIADLYCSRNLSDLLMKNL